MGHDWHSVVLRCGSGDISATSLLRHGKCESVNDAVLRDSTVDEHDLPASFHQVSAPGW